MITFYLYLLTVLELMPDYLLQVMVLLSEYPLELFSMENSLNNFSLNSFDVEKTLKERQRQKKERQEKNRKIIIPIKINKKWREIFKNKTSTRNGNNNNDDALPH